MTSSLRIAVAFVMLLGATALVLFTLSNNKSAPVQAQSAPPPLLTNYLVAAHPLPAGTLARDEDFRVQGAPAAALPAGAIIDTADARADLQGSLVLSFLDTGSAITPTSVLRPRDRGFLATVLEPGTRAISIAVDAASGVSGLIWPGDRVDVVLTHEIENSNPARKALSETVLTNIRVIGIDQDIVQGVPSNNGSAGKLARTVTLQVGPDQVERVAVSEHLGKLSLAVRSAKDQPEIVAHLGGTFAGDVSPALTRGPKDTSVTIVEGDKVKEFSFR